MEREAAQQRYEEEIEAELRRREEEELRRQSSASRFENAQDGRQASRGRLQERICLSSWRFPGISQKILSGYFRRLQEIFFLQHFIFPFQVIQSSRPALQRFEEDEEEFARFQPQRQRNRG